MGRGIVGGWVIPLPPWSLRSRNGSRLWSWKAVYNYPPSSPSELDPGAGCVPPPCVGAESLPVPLLSSLAVPAPFVVMGMTEPAGFHSSSTSRVRL